MERSERAQSLAYSSSMVLQSGENKRRLSAEQVRKLEMCFRQESKLEPAKKAQLARDLGLEPRQVAVWFQNRRVRSRNKQLEKDFYSLQHDYQLLKESYDGLLEEVIRLQSQVQRLSGNSPDQQEGPPGSVESHFHEKTHKVESDFSASGDTYEDIVRKEGQEQQSCKQTDPESCNSGVQVQPNGNYWCNPEQWYPLVWEA